jgi:hypothetical protein
MTTLLSTLAIIAGMGVLYFFSIVSVVALVISYLGRKARQRHQHWHA